MAGVAGVRETVTWFLQMQGDLGASADDTAKKVEALGLKGKAAKEKIKELNEQQKKAAEGAAVWNKNLLGLAAVVATFAIGVNTAVAGVHSWLKATIDANENLKKQGITVGDATAQIDAYSRSVGELSTEWDKLLVNLSGPAFDRFAGLADVGAGIVSKFDSATDSIRKLVQQVEAASSNPAWKAFVESYLAASPYGLSILPGTSRVSDLDRRAQALQTLSGSSSLLGPIAPPPPGSAPLSLRGKWTEFGPNNDDWVAIQNARISASAASAKQYQDSVLAPTSALGIRPTQAYTLPYAPIYGGTQNVSGYVGAAYSQAPPPRPPPTSSGINAGSIAGAIGLLGGGSAGSLLGALGPVGLIAGAAVGAAPQLGSSFDSITSSLSKAPDQLTRGLDHIIDKLPTVLGTVVPDFVGGMVGLIPHLISALVQAGPGIIKAGLVDLPIELANALTPGKANENPRLQGQTRTRFVGFGYNPGEGFYTYGPSGHSKNYPTAGKGSGGSGNNQSRQVNVHVHGGSTQQQIRAIKQALGSYGLNANLDPLVT